MRSLGTVLTFGLLLLPVGFKLYAVKFSQWVFQQDKGPIARSLREGFSFFDRVATNIDFRNQVSGYLLSFCCCDGCLALTLLD